LFEFHLLDGILDPGQADRHLLSNPICAERRHKGVLLRLQRGCGIKRGRPVINCQPWYGRTGPV
jgi:hypothetical protein